MVLIQVKSAAKRTVLGPKKSEKGLFYRLNANSLVFKQFDMLRRKLQIIECNQTNREKMSCGNAVFDYMPA